MKSNKCSSRMAGQFSFGKNQHSCKCKTFLPRENRTVIQLYSPHYSILLILPKHYFHGLLFILCDPHIRYGYSMVINWHMPWKNGSFPLDPPLHFCCSHHGPPSHESERTFLSAAFFISIPFVPVLWENETNMGFFRQALHHMQRN